MFRIFAGIDPQPREIPPRLNRSDAFLAWLTPPTQGGDYDGQHFGENPQRF